MHTKDLKDMKGKEASAIAATEKCRSRHFQQLMKMGYKGCCNLEYEIHEDPMPGMEELFYMRGVLNGLNYLDSKRA